MLGNTCCTRDAERRLPQALREMLGRWKEDRSTGRELLPSQGILHNGERLLVVVLTVVEGSSEDREHDVVATGAEAQLETPIAENVEHCRVLGQP